MYDGAFFSFPRSELESHPIYQREIGAHLPWSHRGVISVYTTLLFVLISAACIILISNFIDLGKLEPIILATPPILFYFLLWEIRECEIIQRYLRSGTLTALNLSRYSPSANYCALIYAHRRLKTIWAIRFLGIAALATFVYIQPRTEFLRSNPFDTNLLVHIFDLGFLTPNIIGICFIFFCAMRRSPIIITYLPVATISWSKRPFVRIFQVLLCICIGISFCIPGMPVFRYMFAFMGFIGWPAIFKAYPYRKLIRDDWNDYLLRLSQGETPNPREYQ